MTEEELARYTQMIDAGYTQTQAEQSVGIQSGPTADETPKPDGWPGWKWDGGAWSDDHDAWGHQIWQTNQQQSNPQLEAIERARQAAQVQQPVADAAAERGEATDSIVDRYSAVQMDTGPADQARQAQQQAMDMQKGIYDKLLSYDPRAEADAASKRAMSRSMVMAQSGGGGAAARQAAQFQALQQSPAIQAEAAAGANQQAQRNTQLAAQAAGEYAQTAAGTRSQDIEQAQAQVNTGLNVANGIANAIGRDLQLTSDEAQFLGKMQLALNEQELDWAKLDEAQRAAAVDEILRKEGLEQAWKQFKSSQDVGALDVVSAIVGTAKTGVQTYAAGQGAGLWGS
jgi:hypothetical protein